MSIQAVISKLQANQAANKLTLHPGADEALLIAVDNTYGLTLPDDFKTLYRFSNGFETEEDIFNMIPLAEIRSNKEGDKDSPLYIAEYMIYSDMWWLEINPDDSNDYKIMAECNGNRLVLTNSLAEFINRFLKGGVFDTGGLYEWHNEIEALPIYSTQLKTAELLLTVFYYGLRYNIISETKIIAWADRLVMHENEPDDFFIDLSLAHDKKDLLNLLFTVTVTENDVILRAILGLLYHHLSAGTITINDAVTVMDKYNLSSPLTETEIHQLYYLADDGCMEESQNNDAELTEKVLEFLSIYKEFEIANYKNWHGFNSRIHYQFQKEGEAGDIQPLKQKSCKNNFNTNWLPNAIVFTLASIAFTVLVTTYPLVKSKTPISSFRSDLYRLSQPFFTVFVCNWLLRGGVWLVEKIASVFKNHNH